ncbi:hypothetical protein ACLB2K_052530 [Fragaria x ananassa]
MELNPFAMVICKCNQTSLDRVARAVSIPAGQLTDVASGSRAQPAGSRRITPGRAPDELGPGELIRLDRDSPYAGYPADWRRCALQSFEHMIPVQIDAYNACLHQG